jgi:hypothetical protein
MSSGVGSGVTGTEFPPPVDPAMETATDFGAPAGSSTRPDVPPTTATP